MIVITGAACFIGSCMVAKLNAEWRTDLILVDDFSKVEKKQNWENKLYVDKIDRKDFFEWAITNFKQIDFIIHLGARTDTTEFDYSVFEELNLDYSCRIWSLATIHGIPMIYASSAATYGNGSLGYCDDHSIIRQLKPLNPYGKSKNEFDKWVLRQTKTPPFWCGFKFFNVFGPNEYHKKRMASVVFHSFNQIKATGATQLFRSHRNDYADGEQIRDFVYVKDVVNTIFYFMNYRPISGIYNLGTGFARSFNALAMATFQAMNVNPNIIYIDMPEDIRDKYQYYTQADMKKMRQMTNIKTFRPLETSIKDYVSHYLMKKATW